MAIVKANYVKRGKGECSRAKASIRYITHRPAEAGKRITRALFGFDGALSKEQTYRMIDEARRGTIFYRIVISPDPKREDRLKDLDLEEITIHTVLALEERLGKQIDFVAALHADHSPHRHVHAFVFVHGRRLNRGDFAALRIAATGRARAQRRARDRTLSYQLKKQRSRTRLHQFFTGGAQPPRRTRFPQSARAYQGFTCGLCGFHLALPSRAGGYRCPACGIKMLRDKLLAQYPARKRRVGLQLTRSP
jgi:DNA-directed RNA polymerase subunit RPC12/RpoP